ncbi:bacteriohopanetetrol glucosamine biosynthesis glycosyltransferase HpnI [Swingsia samuiensis]|uniref:Glycosyltransferase n=1 Tax=Swingsia samuiensis TaxID=1293412 RepID=A0A4Y6UJS9_9PROT|nr:bacteriohopanetetrol glucosamine biosynthesis glycosyltransferase HpnI [Swingsia samuiensis]QDH16651.1 glycosyltransferase [Swingsia samuiensis]
MFRFSSLATGFSILVSSAGIFQNILGATALHRFIRKARISDEEVHSSQNWPAITVLKPLHNNEPLLYEALESVFSQEYPNFQIVFGVQSTQDSALPIIKQLHKQYPHIPIEIVINDAEHGVNRKVSNLINMYEAAQYNYLVISDSDIHCEPNYLKHVASSLAQTNTGLVTTLYAGRPASKTMVQQLGALQINDNFLPGVMMSRVLGRQDCLGATMALTRETLEKIGGLKALANHVADDAVLGQLVRELGLDIAIAPTLTHTTVGEASFKELLLHELRWGRTVKSVEPLGYTLSAIQLPLFWSALALLLRPRSPHIWAFFLSTWAIRSGLSSLIDRQTKCTLHHKNFLLPFRDVLSVAIMLGSVHGTRVAWRGRTVHIKKRKS